MHGKPNIHLNRRKKTTAARWPKDSEVNLLLLSKVLKRPASISDPFSFSEPFILGSRRPSSAPMLAAWVQRLARNSLFRRVDPLGKTTTHRLFIAVMCSCSQSWHGGVAGGREVGSVNS